MGGAVAGTVRRGHRRDGKADAAAADGGQHPGQRIGREQEQHPLRRLFHDLQQGVGGFLVHALHMVQQHRTALGRQAGVEDLAAHGGDLADQIPAASPHALHRDGFAHDAGLDLAAVAFAGLAHSAAAFAPQQGLGGGTTGRIEIICGNAAGRKPGPQPLFAHQQYAVGQAAGRQHLVHAGFQFCVAFHAVQHHGLSAPSDLRLARPADRFRVTAVYRRFLRFHCSRRIQARTLR